MTLVMLVGGAEADEPALGSRTTRLLSDLGVTRVAVLRGEQTTAVILEGWAFDPRDGSTAAGVLFPDAARSVRTFREVADVTLTASGWAAHDPEPGTPAG